ncbi:ComF family protein [Janibacter terrae]|uniref:ComF family protein n=1 Tax=Janibacter terrae TaxID=103817 RepID=UPI00082993F5|nr:phosphoribosyltransferase family protein [Janibacter terrae]
MAEQGKGSVAAVAAAIDLVLPRGCAGCGCAGAALCASCRCALADLALTDLGRVAPHPVPVGWPGCTGTVRYEGLAARVMKSFKDGDRRDLTDPLGRLLADAVLRAVAGPPFVGTGSGVGAVLLVPIPSAPATVRRRGDRPTVLLARRAARLVAGVEVAPALVMARGTADQAGLDRAHRLDNLRGAMTVPRPERVLGRDCLLVDDVLTSGATLAEGRRALLAVGAARVGMAVCMVTPRRSRRPALPFPRPTD